MSLIGIDVGSSSAKAVAYCEEGELLDLLIAVVDQPEPGTLGAAILAGLANAAFQYLDETSQAFAVTSRVFEPDRVQAECHQERIEYYRKTVKQTAERRRTIICVPPRFLRRNCLPQKVRW